MNQRLNEFAAAVAIAGGMAIIALLILIDVLGSAYEAGGF